MPTEPLRIFDPLRNFQLRGFTGRGATTTLHDATDTSVSISGIFQAADDFAVLELFNAYDFYNHLRNKPLPRKDPSGITLQFDLEYDHDLEGCVRLNSKKYPSVAWDSAIFYCGPEMTPYMVKLLDYATAICGSETPSYAKWSSGARTNRIGIQMDNQLTYSGEANKHTTYVHLYFRDTRYTVTNTELLRMPAHEEDPGGLCHPVLWNLDIPAVQLPNGDWQEWEVGGEGFQNFSAYSVPWATGEGSWNTGCYIIIEKGGTNEEVCMALGDGATVRFKPKISHVGPVYIEPVPGPGHFAKQFTDLINNTSMEEVPGRYGPPQTDLIEAIYESSISMPYESPVFTVRMSNWGRDSNSDQLVGVSMSDEGPEYTAVHWKRTGDDEIGYTYLPRLMRFRGGDDTRVWRVVLPFSTLMGRLTVGGEPVPVPITDVRKITLTFAPRFESIEAAFEDGCFLTDGVDESATTWQVDDASELTGGRYFIGDDQSEERVLLLAGAATTIEVQRGYESSTPRSWPAGARLKKLPPVSGFTSDVEWGARISNIVVTGDVNLKVGGDSERIEESDARCHYTGYWEPYQYGVTGWPSQWWSNGHASRTAPNNTGDLRKVTIKYSAVQQHDLYLGTFLYTNCGKVSITVDGNPTAESPADLYLNEYDGAAANVKIASAVAPGNHTVVITALFDRNAASSGYYFYFDYLWPLVAQDAPDAPQEYSDVSLAIDFDTDHGYKKPPAWHLWQLQKLGFKGHADVYMGVFWNNKRRRVGATYPYATIDFAGTPEPGDVLSITIGDSTITHAIGHGEDLLQIVDQIRCTINGMFTAIWADNECGSSTRLRIQSKAPLWTFGISVSAPPSVSMTLDAHLAEPGTEGDWELVDSVSPVMTEGARRWIRDLAGQFAAASIPASFAFSMEAYNPPAAMRAKYLHYSGGVVSPGADVYLETPSYHMHFGPRVREYLKQMYKECADEIAAAGLPVVLQFGETQWWYFADVSGMPFYDQETIDAFAAAKGHQIWPFTANTDDPAGDPAHPYETADFLRDRIWQYCAEVIDYVRRYHPTTVFECLWPLDANQGKPSPDPAYRRLLMHVNLPNEWKTSAYGVKYFRTEGFDYDVWQKNTTLLRQAMTYARDVLGRPAAECIYLSGIYGPPDPPLAQAYRAWLGEDLYSMSFWALDQFCLNSRPVPLAAGQQEVSRGILAAYHKPRIARALEASVAVPVEASADPTVLNRFTLNGRTLNG